MNAKRKPRALAVAGIVAATLIGGGATMAAASTPAGSAEPSVASAPDAGAADTTEANEQAETGTEANEQAETGTEAEDPKYTGSVAAPADPTSAGEDESAEAAALAPLATVDAAAAAAAAASAVPGTAGVPVLEEENGYVVWSVEVTGQDGTVTDVKVDAGNGTVLSQQSGDEEAGETE